MEAVKIVIQSIDDAKAGVAIIEGKPTINLFKDITVGILEGGMQSGATSVMIVLRDGDNAYVGELSARHFDGIAAALRGAESRFADERARKAKLN